MASSAVDKRWRFREGLCAFLAALPIFGFFGFLFMGHRSNRKRFTRIGFVYAVLICGSAALVFISMEIDRNRFLSRVSETSLVLSFAFYFCCFIHTLLCRKNYLKYMAEVILPYAPEAPSPMTDARWRRVNQLWMLWSAVPVVNGFALCFAGRKMNDRKLHAVGAAMVAVSMCLSIFHTYCFVTWRNHNSAWVLFVLPLVQIACILTVFLYRRDYLKTTAALWVADTQAYPNYAKRSWRRANSGWQVLSVLPLVGGMGLFCGGIRAKNKKIQGQGLLLTGLPILALIAYAGLGALSNLSQDFFNIFVILYDMRLYLFVYIQAYCVYKGCLWRRDILTGKAAEFGEYVSDIDREIALQKRYRSRGVQSTTPVPQKPPKPADGKTAKPKSPLKPPFPRPSQTVEEEPASAIDINICTETELCSLPGITLADARRAAEYRDEHHGFRSVDEFIDVLGVKPHFAVQIFKLATALPLPAEEKSAEQEPGVRTHRRSIDL